MYAWISPLDLDKKKPLGYPSGSFNTLQIEVNVLELSIWFDFSPQATV